MLQHVRPAIVLVTLFTILLGVVYPYAIWAVGAVIFPDRAGGSLVKRADGTVVGSALIGQVFTSDKYFHGRPSATVAPDPKDPSKTIDAPYNAANSAGSNYGATSQALVDRVKADVEALRKDGVAGPIPTDAVTTSGSGLDPDMSPEYAVLQIPRVAKARGLSEDKLRAAVAARTQGRVLGFIGEPHVNVLLLNLDLDALSAS
jgi:potassium-transporting ATPase KdpC subunit